MATEPPVQLLEPADLIRRLDTGPPPFSSPAIGPPVRFVDLRDLDRSLVIDDRDRRLLAWLLEAGSVNVGVVASDIDVTFAPLVDGFDILVGVATGATTVIDVASENELPDALAEIERSVDDSPVAAVELVRLLRLTHQLPVHQALHAESVVYGLLQTSDHFLRWLADRNGQPRPRPAPTTPVRMVRRDSTVEITLDRPERRNALDVEMRDGLAEALSLIASDPSIDGAIVRGEGPNFCAGGDLDEFGTTPSPAVGHHVRMTRSLPAMLHRVADRVRVELHGSCVGAGIELPAFAHSVIAAPDATFRLPEVGFGLVPGAGGTVSITRRCGRHRTAWLAITGNAIDAPTARSWGLVDAVRHI